MLSLAVDKDGIIRLALPHPFSVKGTAVNIAFARLNQGTFPVQIQKKTVICVMTVTLRTEGAGFEMDLDIIFAIKDRRV